MKNAGILLILMALVVGAVPQFTDCQSQGKALTLQNGRTTPMKCHWTAMAALIPAGALLVLGGLMVISRRKETSRALSLLGIVLGAGTIMLPTRLIGVCANDDMWCNMIMQPTLIFAGALITAASLVALLIVVREKAEALVPEINPR